MKDTFTTKKDPKIRPCVILVKHHKSAEYGDKSLIALVLKMWNLLPSTIKSLASKECIRT